MAGNQDCVLPAQTCCLSGVLSLNVRHLFLQSSGSFQWPSHRGPCREPLVLGIGGPGGHGLLCVDEWCWYLLARSWWSVCLNIFRLFKKLLILSQESEGEEKEEEKKVRLWFVGWTLVLLSMLMSLWTEICHGQPENSDLSPCPFNYLDIDVERVFILDKKMVNTLGVITGLPHKVWMGLEW